MGCVRSFRKLMEEAATLYENYNNEMGEENRRLVRISGSYRETVWGRLRLLWHYRQFKTETRDVNLGFVLSVLFGKY